MKNYQKVIAAAVVMGCVGVGLYGYHVKQEQLKPEHWVNQPSPDEVTAQDAVTIAGMVQQNKDFSVFVYQCDEVHSYKILIDHPDNSPAVKVIESHADNDTARHFYVTHSDPWHFQDTHGTTWTIEAGQITGNKGLSDGVVCKFNLQKSTDATVDTKTEDYFSKAGA